MDLLTSKNVQTILMVSLGAVLGANLRYWIAVWVGQQRWGAQLPLATLIINLSGSFLLGLIFTLASERFLIDPRLRVLIMIGFLGSYTTFSTYTYESIVLLTAGNWTWGLLNLFGSAVLGGLAVIGGILLGRAL